MEVDYVDIPDCPIDAASYFLTTPCMLVEELLLYISHERLFEYDRVFTDVEDWCL